MANRSLPTYDSLRVATYPIWVYSNTYTTVGKIDYTKEIPTPVGKTEFFLGYSNGKDLHLGGHFYMASQDSGMKDNEAARSESHVYRGDIGVNAGIGNHSLEVALGLADVSFQLTAPNDLKETVALFSNAESEKAFFVNARLFYDMASVGSKLVPMIGYSSSTVNVFKETVLKGGIGVNKDIEKGLFWAGLTGQQRKIEDDTKQAGFFDNTSTLDTMTADTTTNSIKFSFGIEKNIGWPWLMVRVGGQKMIATQTVFKDIVRSGATDKSEEVFATNPDDDGSLSDAIGFGVGFNFGNKLRVDGTINENFPYQNPFGYLGDVGKRLATRVSATYSF
jgi:hypothetical protein